VEFTVSPRGHDVGIRGLWPYGWGRKSSFNLGQVGFDWCSIDLLRPWKVDVEGKGDVTYYL